MKGLVAGVLALAMLLSCPILRADDPAGAPGSKSRQKQAKRKHEQGEYKNGEGSSHKGGHYKNTSTNDHYQKRKKQS